MKGVPPSVVAMDGEHAISTASTTIITWLQNDSFSMDDDGQID